MTIFSSFSANFPPHSYTILAISCVHALNWFTHLQQTRQIDGQNDNSVLTVQVCIQHHLCSTYKGLWRLVVVCDSVVKHWQPEALLQFLATAASFAAFRISLVLMPMFAASEEDAHELSGHSR